MIASDTRVIDKTTYDFSDVAANSSMTIVLVRRFDVSSWPRGIVAVRVWDVTVAQSGATIDVEVYNDGYTTEDPSAPLWQTAAVGTVSLTNADDGSTNLFRLAELDDYPMGSLLLITLTGTQAATQGSLKATISVHVIRKNV